MGGTGLWFCRLTACWMPCKLKKSWAFPLRPTNPDCHLSLFSKATSCPEAQLRVRHGSSTAGGSLASKGSWPGPAQFPGRCGGGSPLLHIFEEAQEGPGPGLCLLSSPYCQDSKHPRGSQAWSLTLGAVAEGDTSMAHAGVCVPSHFTPQPTWPWVCLWDILSAFWAQG